MWEIPTSTEKKKRKKKEKATKSLVIQTFKRV